MRYILIFFMIISTPCFAGIENARDLMESGDFKEAYNELLPAARSGNADAEELIGVMYAMGQGVEKDDQRAFEWYLRACCALKINSLRHVLLSSKNVRFTK